MIDNYKLKTPQIRLKGFSDEWKENKIEDLCSISTGKSNTQDKVDEGIYDFYVRSPIIEKSNKYLYDEEAVLTVGDGVGTGKVFHYVNGKYDLHQRVYRMFDFNKNMTAKFFYRVFSIDFNDRVMSMTAKTSVDSVRYEMIADMEIKYPSLPEQTAIGSFFKTLDSRIEAQEKKIEKLSAMKKALLVKMLPRQGVVNVPEIRFKVFSDAWEEQTLGKVVDVRDGTHDSPKYISNGFPFITSKNIKDGRVNFEDIQYISKEDYDEINKRSKVDLNDILMGMIGTIGNIALVDNNTDFAIKNVALIKSNNLINQKYLFQYLKSAKTVSQLEENQDGGTQKFIALNKVRSLSIFLPSLVEQTAIGTFLKKMDELSSLSNKKLEHLKNIKSALLEKMFV